jgi:hypothetical protein
LQLAICHTLHRAVIRLEGCGQRFLMLPTPMLAAAVPQALMGMFLFGESLPPQWWLGFSLIITGLALVTTGSASVASDDKACCSLAIRFLGRVSPCHSLP